MTWLSGLMTENFFRSLCGKILNVIQQIKFCSHFFKWKSSVSVSVFMCQIRFLLYRHSLIYSCFMIRNHKTETHEASGSTQSSHRDAVSQCKPEVLLQTNWSEITSYNTRFFLCHFLFLSLSSSSLRQDEEHYEQTSDVRSQLRFFEQLERMEKQRKDEQEREILLKAAKVLTHTHAHTHTFWWISESVNWTVVFVLKCLFSELFLH